MNEEPEEPYEPITPEEQAAMDAKFREGKIWIEAEATRIFGPPEIRREKNQQYVSELVARYSEPAIRGLLIALSRDKELLCNEFLAETDLNTTPLWEIIEPFELGGTRFSIVSVEDSGFVVDIAAGFGNAGDGGRFRIVRDGDGFSVKDVLQTHVL